MNRGLYFQCYAGISGDMTVAALLDLGADERVLQSALQSLPLDCYSVKISKVNKWGIAVCDFTVTLDEKFKNHDHNMAYLYGKNHDVDLEQDHGCYYRNLNDVMEIINKGKLTKGARNLAERIFTILAEAEAKAHGKSVAEVHFHEVGAVDSIVDIVGAAVCLDNLGYDKVFISPLWEGTGFVRCAHGMLPIPVPAVTAIAADHGLNIAVKSREGEFVTPTGAAIAAAIKTDTKLPENFVIKKIGIGAGKRNYDVPSILRVMAIEYDDGSSGAIYKLESNIDDCTGEALGYVMNRLFEAGARDVHYISVYMKKNRPGYQLNVICDEDHIPVMEEIIFAETTTIGIRRQKIERTVLNRKIVEVETSLGKAMVKICDINGCRRVYPEYESVKSICEMHKLPYQDVYRIVQNEVKI